eukprot:TRINITY_DN5097_c0_g1_i2.p1 TRINITY_DN5097_c0_g1~~TRINITY_DN5097_c0_g1_i2.p1  ORF type:complete len:200 (-),score=48.55 TRINITY_DN5097_c0_g1_i2:414-1013(-)
MNPLLFVDLHEVEQLDLVCGICLYVVDQPMTILPANLTSKSAVPCQHSFCNACLTKWRATKVNVCPICQAVIESVFPDVKVKGMLAKQMVRCSRFEKGCTAVGKLGMDKNNFFDEHDKECGYVEMTCDCAEVYMKKDASEHFRTCPIHLMVTCPFKAFGCKEECKKSDLQNHLTESDRPHLVMMLHSTKVSWRKQFNAV